MVAVMIMMIMLKNATHDPDIDWCLAPQYPPNAWQGGSEPQQQTSGSAHPPTACSLQPGQ